MNEDETMRTFAAIAAIIAVFAATAQPTLAQSGANPDQLVIKQKSSRSQEAPIEDKAKKAKSKQKVPDKCGPTMPGKPSTSTC